MVILRASNYITKDRLVFRILGIHVLPHSVYTFADFVIELCIERKVSVGDREDIGSWSTNVRYRYSESVWSGAMNQSKREEIYLAGLFEPMLQPHYKY